MPYFTSLGWHLVVIALLFILANRFSKARRAAEYLNIHLQDEVNDRTKDWEIAYSFKPMPGFPETFTISLQKGVSLTVLLYLLFPVTVFIRGL